MEANGETNQRNELPAHTDRVDGFCMNRAEVTNALTERIPIAGKPGAGDPATRSEASPDSLRRVCRSGVPKQRSEGCEDTGWMGCNA